MNDRYFSRKALAMMRLSDCKHNADPKVGAVLACGEELIGCQKHTRQGHAERELLLRIGKENAEGATLYTTLEPCTFRGVTEQGERKESCAETIRRFGVRRVVIGMLDPNPFILGNGIQFLRQYGIDVELFPPDLTARIEKLNHKFCDAFGVVGGDSESEPPFDICGHWNAVTRFDDGSLTKEEVFLQTQIGNRVYGVMHNRKLDQKYNFYLMSMTTNVWDYVFRSKPNAKELDHGAGVLIVHDQNTARATGVAHGIFSPNKECVRVTVDLSRVSKLDFKRMAQ
jgi:diaminohydroxyphosphoribosylaminopyrimidine deaminase/5-amino-6-(5-phosphoribosylamino)uracil reductase